MSEEKYHGWQQKEVNYLRGECIWVGNVYGLGAKSEMLLVSDLKTDYITVVVDLLILQFYTDLLPTPQLRCAEKQCSKFILFITGLSRVLK